MKLSICIPTYNFGNFIVATLKSITDQNHPQIEIVIGDGASTDETESVVKAFQDKFPNIKYFRFETKGGIDIDLLKTVSMAKGEFCWLLSSDDVIVHGAIEIILNKLNNSEKIILCNRFDCNRDLKIISERYWLKRKQQDEVFDWSNSGELARYLISARRLGALFSFLSVIIVNRASWNSVKQNAGFLGTNYAHVDRIIKIAKSGGKLQYCKASLVLGRHYNDSFMKNGIIIRYCIDFDGFAKIIDENFQNEYLAGLVNNIIRREHKWYHLISLRNRVNLPDWEIIEPRLVKCGYNSLLRLVVRTIGGSQFIVPFSRVIKCFLSSRFGGSRF